MKKVKSIIFLWLFAVSMLLLTSCELLPTDWFNFRSLKKPESAEEVFERMNEAMEDEDSYQLYSTCPMTIYVDGERYDSDNAMKIIWINGGEGEEYFYRETTSSTKYLGRRMGEPITSVEAYYDGKAFVRYYGDIDRSFYSPMSSETFYDCFISSEEDFIGNGDFLDCSSKSFKETEDGGWEISCSGYSAAFIEELSDTIGVFGDYGISDAVVTLRCDKRFLPTEFNVSIVFDVKPTSADKPSLEYSGRYSEFGTVKPITDHFNVDDYTAVDDLHMLYKIEDMLEEHEDAEYGFFTLDVETAVNAFSQQTITVEHDEVSYGVKKNGDYYYTVNYTIDGSSGVMNYGKGESFASDDNNARAFINNLINIAGYDRNRVSNITAFGNGVYLIEIEHPDEQRYRNFLEAYGMLYGTCTPIKIFYTVEDEKIVGIDSYITVEAISGGRYVDIAISSEVNFKPLSER